MQELFLSEPNKLSLREVATLPVPIDNEIKVKVIYGGICGSDLRVYRGSIAYASYPIRPGHEVLGVVTEVGKDSSLVVGTNVVIFPNTFCGKCEHCLQGKTNICKEKKPLGVAVDGVFAEEVIIASKYAVPVPADMPNERAILVEPFAVTVHALKRAYITTGTTVAIIGSGTEGLLAVALATKLGAKVTAIDINPKKLELAKKLGDVQALTPENVAGQTFDVVVEAAGVKQSFEQAFQLVKPGGTIVALGISSEQVAFSPIQVVRSEISINGSIIYTLKDFADAIAHLSDPTFYVEPITSKFIPLKQYQEAFEDAFSGDYAKIVLEFPE
jgi:L-iditol 2-dehydrogenase